MEWRLAHFKAFCVFVPSDSYVFESIIGEVMRDSGMRQLVIVVGTWKDRCGLAKGTQVAVEGSSR